MHWSLQLFFFGLRIDWEVFTFPRNRFINRNATFALWHSRNFLIARTSIQYVFVGHFYQRQHFRVLHPRIATLFQQDTITDNYHPTTVLSTLRFVLASKSVSSTRAQTPSSEMTRVADDLSRADPTLFSGEATEHTKLFALVTSGVALISCLTPAILVGNSQRKDWSQAFYEVTRSLNSNEK